VLCGNCPQNICHPQVHGWKNVAKRDRTLPEHSHSLGGGCLHRPSHTASRLGESPMDASVLQPRVRCQSSQCLPSPHLPAAVCLPALLWNRGPLQGVPVLIHKAPLLSC